MIIELWPTIKAYGERVGNNNFPVSVLSVIIPTDSCLCTFSSYNPYLVADLNYS